MTDDERWLLKAGGVALGGTLVVWVVFLAVTVAVLRLLGVPW